MRPMIMIPLIAAASVARADTTVNTPLVDMRVVDAPCRVLAGIPRNSVDAKPSFDAAISTANCLATTRTRAIHLSPTKDGVGALDAAVAPALAILDRVIKTGDLEHQLIALFSKVDIREGNSARLMATLPELSPQIGSKEVADHEHDVRVAAGLTQPWRHLALEDRRRIARLVDSHPELVTRNVVVANMVVRSRIVEAAGVASRTPR